MDIYFVTCGNKDELQVIKEIKPKNILISYFYFKKRSRIEDLLEKIEYRPNILLDSGAYSAMTREKNISIIDYMNFITINHDLFDSYIQLDVFGNGYITQKYLEIMLHEGFKPIPVYQYGTNEYYIDYLMKLGFKRIALGGTVPFGKDHVAEWLKFFCWLHPEIDFHLLGSSSLRILDTCDVASVDSSTWILSSSMGKPNHIKSKKERMKHHMIKLMKYENQTKGL